MGKREITYDKPRITSTIIIGVFLTIAMFFAILFAPVTWSAVKAAADAAKDSSEEVAGQVAGSAAVAFVGAIGMVLVIIVYIGVLIDTAIILPFSIKNRKSTLKPVRIISYVLDGLIGATLLFTVVKLILCFAGV